MTHTFTLYQAETRWQLEPSDIRDTSSEARTFRYNDTSSAAKTFRYKDTSSTESAKKLEMLQS